MLKRLYIALAFVFASVALNGTAASLNQWTYYLAYQNATQVVPAGQTIYTLFDGNLLSYDKETQEVHLFSRTDGLTGQKISHLAFSSQAKALFIVYNDLGIDILHNDGSVTSLQQLKENYSGISTVNDLTITANTAVLAMNDGVIMANISKGDFISYYKINHSVKSAIIKDNVCYAATPEGIYAGKMSDNISDPSQWKLSAAINAENFTPFGSAVYFNVTEGSEKGFWRFVVDSDGNGITPMKIADPVFPQLTANEQTLLAKSGSWVFVYDVSQPFGAQYALEAPQNCNSLAIETNGTIWSASGFDGLRAYQLKDQAWADQGISIGHYGPRRDLCYYLRFVGNRLLVGGGRLDPADELHYDGTVMTFENNRWHSFQEDGISAATGLPYRDITSVAQDPADSSHIFATAAGTGLYEFKSGKFVKNYSISNSPLRSAASDGNTNYVRADGLNYDADGNLWMINNEVDSVICVLRANGQWAHIYVSALAQQPTMEKTLFDRNGRFWVTSRRSARGITAGLACFDYGGTFNSTRDDVTTFRSSVYNQDGSIIDLSQGVYAICEDRNGALWIGTATGLYVIDNPDEWSSSSFRITQVKVPRNDGTNYADYLLDGVAINDIAVDGANRKWIATLSNGLYLVSADGTEILHHFLASDSPLLSDVVYSVAVNPTTGEVFIGTDAGLCSFQSDATEPAGSLNKSNVKVYPNPVRPEYRGNVTITGLTENADVKITTTGGQVVTGGTSHGGMFTWNVRNMEGARVATGVYFVMCATENGSQGIVAKVVVI